MAHITFTASNVLHLKERVRVYGLLTDLPASPAVRSLASTSGTLLQSVIGLGLAGLVCVWQVGIIMGSDSDLPTMKDAAEVLEQLGIRYELTVVSAHRTPTRMYHYAQTAAQRGVQVRQPSAKPSPVAS